MKISGKLKALIVVASLVILGLVGAIVGVVVSQNANVAKLKSLAFSKPNFDMLVGETSQAQIVFAPMSAKNKKVTFASENENIIKIVSTSQTYVMVQAVGVGETNITVTSVANKKLSDSCHVSVTDNLIEKIEFFRDANSDETSVDKVNVTIGIESSIDIVATPATGNLQKLNVVSYDSNVFSYVNVSVNDGKAKLNFLPKAAGISQIVVGVWAETESSDVLVMSKPILIEIENLENRSLKYDISSSFYSNDELVTSSVVLIPKSADYVVYLKFYVDIDGAEKQYIEDASDVSLLGETNPNLNFEYFKEQNDEKPSYVIVSKKDNNWSNEAVVFSYQGLSVSIYFVLFDGFNLPYVGGDRPYDGVSLNSDLLKNPTSDNSITNPYELDVENYKLFLTENLQKQLMWGVVSINAVNETNYTISESGVLSCKSAEDSAISISIVFNISYWDGALIYTYTDSDVFQREIYITINQSLKDLNSENNE